MMTKEELSEIITKAVKEAGAAQGADVIKVIQEKLGTKLAAPEVIKAIGEQFTESQAVKDFVKSQAKNTPEFPVNMKAWGYGLKAGERINSRFDINVKAGEVITSMFPSERTYLPFAEFPQRRFRLRDLIPVAGLGTPQIEYARITGYSNLAAGAAELASKPQSQIFTQVVVDAVKLIATFMPVTRQAVADVPGLAGYINQVLVYFMQLSEDAQILSGAGGGTDMTGILNVPGIQSRPKGADTYIDAIRKAITDLQIAFTDAGFQPNGVVMHPRDWETFELQKDTTNKYLLIPFVETAAEGGPQPPRLWRLPVVPTPAMTLGTALVGAFDIGATLWTYEDVTLRITDSHSDFFVKNLLAVLAEYRELLAVYFPRAFVQVTGL